MKKALAILGIIALLASNASLAKDTYTYKSKYTCPAPCGSYQYKIKDKYKCKTGCAAPILEKHKEKVKYKPYR